MSIELAKNPYYETMLKKGRLIPFFKNNELVCFISFFITDNPEEIINREDSWSVVNDNEKGRYALIDQIWSDRKCYKESFKIWQRMIAYIKANFPQVEYLRWNRWKNNRLYVFSKKINGL